MAYNNLERFVDTKNGKDILQDTVGIIFQDVEDFQESLDISSIPSESEKQSQLCQSRKRRLGSMDAVTLESESYGKRPKFTKTLERYDSPLRLQYKNIDFAWVSHYLKLS